MNKPSQSKQKKQKNNGFKQKAPAPVVVAARDVTALDPAHGPCGADAQLQILHACGGAESESDLSLSETDSDYDPQYDSGSGLELGSSPGASWHCSLSLPALILM